MKHEILTSTGWKLFNDITCNDKIASLKGGKELVYEKPIRLFSIPRYSGQMYKIENHQIDFDITICHKMYVSSPKCKCGRFFPVKAGDLKGKTFKYKRNAAWSASNYHNEQIKLFGTWTIGLPEWIWNISSLQCRDLLNKFLNITDSTCDNAISIYHSPSKQMADDVSRLCLHAGWASTIIDERVVEIDKENGEPIVTGEGRTEDIYEYTGPVFCIQVPSDVFYVRRNGKAAWTSSKIPPDH